MTSGTTATPDLDARLARYADDLRARGAIRSDAVHKAFASVPRHRFLRTFHFRADRFALAPGEQPAAELLDIIYANNSLVTHDGHDGDPMSSSSGPSVMARMLEALDLRPGMRVLEIGAGTGYNAALIHQITGAPVTTIEAGRATAAAAAAAMTALGLAEKVRVVHGDGYLGDPDGKTWDRVIVTCGVAGIPPRWLDHLAPRGLVLAPIAHAGVHPILAIHAGDGSATGVISLWADFMPAAGNLRPDVLFGHNPEHDITAAPVQRLPGAAPVVGADRYNDLTCFLAAQDDRTTRAFVDDPAFDPASGMTALVEDGAAAWIQHTGDLVVAGDSEHTGGLQARLRELTASWLDNGRPELEHWNTALAERPGLPAPLLTPGRWSHIIDGSR
ncbi:protein-L-isoaspartate O-methyltransferase [Amycolatopsis sp. GM8]|uniref:protein-L-isoaspartate O-methyltransferase family protein n=1 Tax=Amycolatopsis sp. GM8 TaxID=2896530 RepID=UPI001F37D9E9|nr:rRNA adenine N-6-methyltransferase family protein [Amycolatopsis sp. GM8]